MEIWLTATSASIPFNRKTNLHCVPTDCSALSLNGLGLRHRNSEFLTGIRLTKREKLAPAHVTLIADPAPAQGRSLQDSDP